jgi:fused signal recognition particle receptor
VFERLRQSLRGVIEKVSSRELTEKDLDPIFWDIHLQLIANDVAVEVSEKICSELKENLKGEAVPRLGDKSKVVREALRASLESVMATSTDVDLLLLAEGKKAKETPLVVLFIGINGTGKTTTIAKLARLLLVNGYSVVLASGDTYRAGAIEQLQVHANRLGIRAIKHSYGADPAAVSYDAVRHAEARKINAVLIDTAGRMQTNKNLMDELRKIKRVIQPDLTVMVVDSLTGNDAIEQAETFNEHIGFDAAILTKVDADAKGGSSLSIPYLTGKPIIYLGTGQGYDDLEVFKVGWFSEKIVSGEKTI